MSCSSDQTDRFGYFALKRLVWRNWRETNRLNEELKAGIDTDKEQRLLRKWHETH
jgi:hypothetical protein